MNHADATCRKCGKDFIWLPGTLMWCRECKVKELEKMEAEAATVNSDLG